MKKKLIIILLMGFIIIGLTGCDDKKDDNKSNNEERESKDIIKEENTSLVLYFSATGTTRKVAERIADKSGSDLIEIVPKEKYTSDDLNYNSDCRANREQNDDKARPEIKNKIDISKYNTIYLGYPIWWGTNPRIILTLLDSYDFSNKVIIPFCTSGSSGISTSVNDLRKYNNKLNIKDGKRFTTSDSDQVIEDFINNNK